MSYIGKRGPYSVKGRWVSSGRSKYFKFLWTCPSSFVVLHDVSWQHKFNLCSVKELITHIIKSQADSHVAFDFLKIQLSLLLKSAQCDLLWHNPHLETICMKAHLRIASFVADMSHIDENGTYNCDKVWFCQ